MGRKAAKVEIHPLILPSQETVAAARAARKARVRTAAMVVARVPHRRRRIRPTRSRLQLLVVVALIRSPRR